MTTCGHTFKICESHTCVCHLQAGHDEAHAVLNTIGEIQ